MNIYDQRRKYVKKCCEAQIILITLMLALIAYGISRITSQLVILVAIISIIWLICIISLIKEYHADLRHVDYIEGLNKK